MLLRRSVQNCENVLEEQNKLMTIQSEQLTRLEAQIWELMETFQALKDLEELKLSKETPPCGKKPDDLILAGAIDNFR